MRVLFVTPPGYGLLFPLVPLAHALRAAGHEVLVGTTAAFTGAAAGAGLPAVDVAPGADLSVIFDQAQGQFGSTKDGAEPWSGPSLFSMLAIAMLDGTIAVARKWRADLIVHTPHGLAGQYAAAVLDLPSVFHGLGFVHTPAMMAERSDHDLLPTRGRLDLPAAPVDDAGIDIAPPSMRLVEDYGLAMRPTTYNGGGVLPAWLLARPERPRITVTLGTVTPSVEGLGPVRWVVDAAARVDAEFVLALGGSDTELKALGDLPDNVRPVGWVPLGALLATSSAVVHHGGAGTTLTAVAAGLPQIVLPQGADQFGNATAVSQRGVGFTAEPDQFGPDILNRLLTDPALRAAAGEVQRELAAMPAPAALVAQLAKLID
jgi:UDP:flavonoid glycosyltransferase YjiC (YdhE family)